MHEPNELIRLAAILDHDGDEHGVGAQLRQLAQQSADFNQQMNTRGEAALRIVGWVHEDDLPEGYPYDEMFPHSKVDGVRVFPVYAPDIAGRGDAEPEGFQARVAPWMAECFGPAIASDVREPGDRLLEEVLELLQSHVYDHARVATLRDYVFGRPVGEPAQEVGGVMVTLAAYCLATGIDMHHAGETELQRIWTKVEKIRAKQASKRDLHSPLPAAGNRQMKTHGESKAVVNVCTIGHVSRDKGTLTAALTKIGQMTLPEGTGNQAVAEVYERFVEKRDVLGEAYRDSEGPALRFTGDPLPVGTKLYTGSQL